MAASRPAPTREQAPDGPSDPASSSRAAELSGPAGLTWIATRNRNHSLCVIDCSHVPEHMLRSAKAISNNLLLETGSMYAHMAQVPYELDGGWPDIHPHDECVAFARLGSGPFEGVTALARAKSVGMFITTLPRHAWPTPAANVRLEVVVPSAADGRH